MALHTTRYASQRPVAVGRGMAYATLSTGIVNSVTADAVTDNSSASAAVITGSGTTFDFSSVESTAVTFYLSTDGGTTYIPIAVADISAGADDMSAVTAAEIKAVLDANAEVAKHITTGTTTNITFTTKALGDNVAFYVKGEAALTTALGVTNISAATEAVGDNGAPLVECTVVDHLGQELPFTEVLVEIFTDANGSTLLADSIIYGSTRGGIISGAYTNSAVLCTDKEGKFNFRVATGATEGAGAITAFIDTTVRHSTQTVARTSLVIRAAN